MPKITIELTEDKLFKLIPILLKEGVKHLISPDKPTDIVSHYTVKNTQSDLFDKTNNEIIVSGQSYPREVKHVNHVKGTTLSTIVLDHFKLHPNDIFCAFDLIDLIVPMGFKANSASSTLTDLWQQNKLARIRVIGKGKSFYYSLVK